MKLSVENLGVISKAEIDLSKDLIIFTGENNTGKTYLATVIYFLYQNLKVKLIEAIYSLDGFSTNIDSASVNLIEQKENIVTYLSTLLNDELTTNLSYLFSAKEEYFLDTKNNIKISSSDISDEVILYLKINEDQIFSKIKNLDNHDFYVDKELGSPYVFILKKINQLEGIPNTITLPLIGIFNKSFIIPAERQGINLFHKELSLIKNKTFDNLLQNGSREKLFNFLQTRFNKYALPIKDSLEFNQNLDAIKTNKGEYSFLADELDKNFLQGNIKIDDEGDISFKPEKSKKSLDFHLTSSTVKSLSSLSIYLRYVAAKGDFIIIDEPELNLHPDNQRKIARFISRLINEGFKVMISTHSDYIIRELNSLIMLSSGKEKNEKQTKALQKKYKYKDEELLSKDKVGVYLFKQNKPVKKVRVSDTGFEISTIDQEVEKLNQSSQDIYFSLFDE